MRQARRTTAGLMAASLMAAIVAPAAAQTALVEQTALRLEAGDSGGARTCVLTLTPALPIGAEAPALYFATEPYRRGQPPATVLELGVENAPEGMERLEIVAGDTRETIGVSNPFDLTAQRRPLALQALLARQPVHLTARLADGTYQSAAFEAPGFAQAVAVMHRECGVDTTTLPGMADLFAEEERALALGKAEMRTLVYKLHSKYENTETPPPVGATLAPASRALLLRYSRESGLTPSSYLTPALIDRLGREAYEPKRVAYRAPDFRRSRDWYTYSLPDPDGDGKRCVLGTEARTLDGGIVWSYPHLQFSALEAEGRGLLRFDLLTPNVLDVGGGRATAAVNGLTFTLRTDPATGLIVPAFAGGQPFTRFLRAVQSGIKIEIRGPHADSEASLVIDFSALGFTAGFNRLMSLCGRPDLKAWLR